MKDILDDITPLGLEKQPEKEISVPTKLEEVSMNQKGVEALSKAIEFIGLTASVIKKAEADGKITLTDAIYAAPLVFKIVPLVEAVKEIPAELKDQITPEEIAILADTVVGMDLIPSTVPPDAIKRILAFIAEGKAIMEDYFV